MGALYKKRQHEVNYIYISMVYKIMGYIIVEHAHFMWKHYVNADIIPYKYMYIFIYIY